MLTLAQYLTAKRLSKSAFARRLAARLSERIPPQSVHRWTLPKNDPDYSVPGRRRVEAIELETDGEVGPASWYWGGSKSPRKSRSQAINIAATRKAAAVRQRRREARA